MTFEDKCYGQSFLILNEFKENICTLHDNTQNVFLGINEKYETLSIYKELHLSLPVSTRIQGLTYFCIKNEYLCQEY